MNIIVDYYRSIKALISRSEELNYLTAYGLFSGATHSGASYLASNIIKRSNDGISVLTSGNAKKVPLYAWIASDTLLFMTEIFMRRFKTDTLKSLKPIKRRLKIAEEKIPK